ncbi:uncharacterized protein [Petaurus breviceps papuanus]|uniref:uncharacterized protein n=1 Tax=Petaurus breviceps papuanus TaxID=3040969 RepID=UPI0036D84934
MWLVSRLLILRAKANVLPTTGPKVHISLTSYFVLRIYVLINLETATTAGDLESLWPVAGEAVEARPGAKTSSSCGPGLGSQSTALAHDSCLAVLSRRDYTGGYRFPSPPIQTRTPHLPNQTQGWGKRGGAWGPQGEGDAQPLGGPLIEWEPHPGRSVTRSRSGNPGGAAGGGGAVEGRESPPAGARGRSGGIPSPGTERPRPRTRERRGQRQPRRGCAARTRELLQPSQLSYQSLLLPTTKIEAGREQRGGGLPGRPRMAEESRETDATQRFLRASWSRPPRYRKEARGRWSLEWEAGGCALEAHGQGPFRGPQDARLQVRPGAGGPARGGHDLESRPS